ncbi:MAG TPA: class I SAM-dependent methyltransferase [Hyphomicrobiaceae bacterium]|nr:class I SAM-dependent methyltransferase [Hyphomicrobiaceae bacterium]
MQDIYDPLFVKGVFDRCSAAYRYWSQIASFGFIFLWRRQCVDHMPAILPDGATGLDLMAGTGEAWPYLLRRRANIASITAVDISSEMIRRALDRLHRSRLDKIKLIEVDVLKNSLAAESADFVISTFGLKTFNQSQQRHLATELARVLRRGGVFSLIEASDPKGWVLHGLYRFYLSRVLPLVEKIVLKGAQDFSMIGVYTRNFGDCRFIAQCLVEQGVEVEFKVFFFGCATGVVGRKP